MTRLKVQVEATTTYLVASSSRRIEGLRKRDRAIAIRCFWPPET